ncbi:MAG: PACE efflux transporter [Devosia sp.]|uniref:PACE efflux transporter n=1 Tax=Devosia sp. TaxID=1871048 RepID=UPI003394C247
MRTTADRIRHAVSFEVIGIIIATPLAAFAFHLPSGDSAVIVVASATVAMLWNYVYNLGFDHAMQRLTGGTAKTTRIRVAHAVLFELGLLMIMLPLVAWYLQISIWQALVMDIALALFYMGYAFVFNWGYDRVFPLPEWKAKEA